MVEEEDRGKINDQLRASGRVCLARILAADDNEEQQSPTFEGGLARILAADDNEEHQITTFEGRNT